MWVYRLQQHVGALHVTCIVLRMRQVSHVRGYLGYKLAYHCYVRARWERLSMPSKWPVPCDGDGLLSGAN